MEKMKELLKKETSKDMAKLAIGGIATATVVKLFTASCLVFSFNLLVAVVILAFIAVSLVNRRRVN